MTRHFLALEHLARILALARGPVRAVRDRDTVRRPEAAEVVPLHRAGKTLADRSACDVHVLACQIVVGGDFRAHIDQVVGADAEFSDLALGFHIRPGEVPAHAGRGPLGLGRARAELDGGIAIPVSGALRHNLQVVELKHGHRNLLAVFQQQPGHAQLLRDYARAHCHAPLNFDFDVNAGSEVELHERVHGLRGRVDDVEKTLVRPDFPLVARLLVDVRTTENRELLDLVRQRDRATHLRAGPLGRVHDFQRAGIQHTVIEGFQPDTDGLRRHFLALGLVDLAGGGSPASPDYSMIFDTTPAPTVRPPSRMAKRSFSSMAMGAISSTLNFRLSPGITISVPSGS